MGSRPRWPQDVSPAYTNPANGKIELRRENSHAVAVSSPLAIADRRFCVALSPVPSRESRAEFIFPNSRFEYIED